MTCRYGDNKSGLKIALIATLPRQTQEKKTGDITPRILMSITLSSLFFPSVGLSLLLVLSLHPVNEKVSLLFCVRFRFGDEFGKGGGGRKFFGDFKLPAC